MNPKKSGGHLGGEARLINDCKNETDGNDIKRVVVCRDQIHAYYDIARNRM